MGSEEGTGCGLYLKGPEFLGTYFTGAGQLERCSSHPPENKKNAWRPSRAANYDEMIRSCGFRPESYSSQPGSFRWPEKPISSLILHDSSSSHPVQYLFFTALMK